MSTTTTAFSRAAAASRRSAAEPMRWVRDDRFQYLISLLVWILLVLMIVPEGFDYSHLASGVSPVSTGAVSSILWLGLLVGGGVLTVWRGGFVWLLLRWLNPVLVAFFLLALLSLAWSIDPAVTARRLIRVVSILGVAIAFVVIGWHPLRFQNVLRPILTAALLGSLLFGLIWPTLAIHQETSGVLQNAWHGLATQKNALGDIASIGLIFWFHAWLCRDVRPLTALLGCGIAMACLVLSRSSTSMMAAVFTLLFLAMLLRSSPSLRRYMPYLVTLFVVCLLIYSLAILHVVPGLDVLLIPISMVTGKDLTFTGRTEIWELITEVIRQRPLWGSGYGAYWTGGELGTPAYEFVARLYFYPGSAHNGYLEVLTDLGMLGLILLLGYLVNYLLQCLQLLQTNRFQAALYLALFLQQAIVNLSESRWLNVQSAGFVIMTLATFAIARNLLEHRLQQYLGQPRAPAAGTPAAAVRSQT